MPNISPGPEHQQVFEQTRDALVAGLKEHPDLKAFEILAIVGQLVGTCIAEFKDHERALAQMTVLENSRLMVQQIDRAANYKRKLMHGKTAAPDGQ